MDKYNPKKHHRRSIRLRGYDYSQAGLYFITLCVQDRLCLLGEIENNEMILNAAGKMVEEWYYELENKFPDVKCHEMIVMPNHFHCIIENTGTASVGADLRVCPETETGELPESGEHRALLCEHRELSGEHRELLGEHTGSPLHRVVQWFKTMSTNEYIRGVKNLGWSPLNGKLWQRNYYEHIIRNEQSYQKITEYIQNNPANLNTDALNLNIP